MYWIWVKLVIPYFLPTGSRLLVRHATVCGHAGIDLRVIRAIGFRMYLYGLYTVQVLPAGIRSHMSHYP
jgi:hypothetical protein